MQCILIAIIVLGLLVLTASCRNHKPVAPNPAGTTITTTPPTQFLTQEQIRQQLQKVAQSPRPKTRELGAMCYKMASPHEHAEYTCPVCGSKTLYLRETLAPSIEGMIYDSKAFTALTYELDACRRKIKEVPKLFVELDESQFCKHCSPDIEIPSLILIIHYPEMQKDHRYEGITSRDLELLIQFLKGKKKYQYAMDDETAVKDHLEQLEKIVGVEINNAQ